MKVVFAPPRYGAEVVGGAEHGCRILAEHLARHRPSWAVEVLTTTAATVGDDWHAGYPAGYEEVNGIPVTRYPLEGGRGPDFHAFLDRVLQRPQQVDAADQERFAEEVGPRCPELVGAVAASGADATVFYPYLFWPTIRGAPAAAGRVVLHPAAHDEPPLRLPLFRPVFERVDGFVFQTPAEQRLVRSLFDIDRARQTIVGLGIDDRGGDPAMARDALGLDDAPFLLCIGRVDRAKGCHSLARFFAGMKQVRPGPLKLVFLGPVTEPVPPHPDIVEAGPVDEDTKWGALAAAAALVSPSAFEAFSLVVMEAWSARRPVLVNARCAVTREHAFRSGGGVPFDGLASFWVAVDRLLGDGDLAARMGEAGRAYVDQHYRWPTVIDHYARFLELVATR